LIYQQNWSTSLEALNLDPYLYITLENYLIQCIFLYFSLEVFKAGIVWIIEKLLTPGDIWPWRPGWLENRASCVRGWAHHRTGRVGNWPLHRHRRTVPTRGDTLTRPEEQEDKRRIVQVILRLSICLSVSLKILSRFLLFIYKLVYSVIPAGTTD